jgi:hypothetical protein
MESSVGSLHARTELKLTRPEVQLSALIHRDSGWWSVVSVAWYITNQGILELKPEGD